MEYSNNLTVFQKKRTLKKLKDILCKHLTINSKIEKNNYFAIFIQKVNRRLRMLMMYNDLLKIFLTILGGRMKSFRGH